MATTKIWPVHDSLKRVLGYAANPEKTETEDLRQVLHYAGKSEKTVSADERSCFVTGVGCKHETAYDEMCAVKERFGKCDGNVSYHAYQSFKPGEVTPVQCHEIGVKLARRLWGKRFQVLVATHLDRGHLHNHFVINSVSFVDGMKFNCNKKAYYDMRKTSDELCRSAELSVIKNPKGKTPRNLYFAEKNGEPTKYNLMKEAIDTAIRTTSCKQDFFQVLKNMGYFIDDDPNRKYATIRRIGDKKPVRLFRLGTEYDMPRIKERVNEQYFRYGQNLYRHNQKKSIPPKATSTKKQYVFLGSFYETKKITGFRALYLHYCYLLGVLPKRKDPPRPLSPQMREACRRMHEISRQVRLICDKKLDTDADVQTLVSANIETLTRLQNERNICYNRLRRCTDPEEIAEIKERRDALTAQMTVLRKENKLAESIPVRAAAMKDDIGIERQMRSEMRIREQKNAIKTKETRDSR